MHLDENANNAKVGICYRLSDQKDQFLSKCMSIMCSNKEEKLFLQNIEAIYLKFCVCGDKEIFTE